MCCGCTCTSTYSNNSNNSSEVYYAALRCAAPCIHTTLYSLLCTAAGGVLVHCAQGMSRSAAVVAGYIMARGRLDADEAVARVRAARPTVRPNEGFALQLHEFGRDGCDPKRWRGWDAERLCTALSASSVSGRRALHGFSSIVRRFHVHDIERDDGSTVFADTSVMLPF